MLSYFGRLREMNSKINLLTPYNIGYYIVILLEIPLLYIMMNHI